VWVLIPKLVKKFRDHNEDMLLWQLWRLKLLPTHLLVVWHLFRVYSGKIDAGSYVLNTRTDKKERIARLFQMKSNKQLPREVIGTGDIGAAVGFKDIRTVIPLR
jgi:translation elongation factor EF-G